MADAGIGTRNTLAPSLVRTCRLTAQEQRFGGQWAWESLTLGTALTGRIAPMRRLTRQTSGPGCGTPRRHGSLIHRRVGLSPKTRGPPRLTPQGPQKGLARSDLTKSASSLVGPVRDPSARNLRHPSEPSARPVDSVHMLTHPRVRRASRPPLSWQGPSAQGRMGFLVGTGLRRDKGAEQQEGLWRPELRWKSLTSRTVRFAPLAAHHRDLEASRAQ
jgi:hypothetical protein